MLMFNDHIGQFFKNIQNKLNVINKNINHTTETIKFYAATTKKKNMHQIEIKSMTSMIFYNNEQQKRQLNESQKKKIIMVKIKKQKNKKELKILSTKELLKRVTKIKKKRNVNDASIIKRRRENVY
jgi:wyosine [tRNA(Phe)-imidazoG37] synthetase (radical SAM superfamily)